MIPNNQFFFNSKQNLFLAETKDYMAALGIPNDSTTYYSGNYLRTGSELWDIIDRLFRNWQGIGDINSTVDFWFTKNTKVLWPQLGGTALRHSYNAIDPLTFPLSFLGGGWTHSATGAKPNGSSSYADTGINTDILDGNNVNFGRWNGPGSVSEELVWEQLIQVIQKLG